MIDFNKTFRFREFKVYKDSRIYANELKSFVGKNFPKEERFSLTSQVYRALDSIILNIAEGADRGTDKDFALFLNRAHTSLNEVVACLDVALDNSYIAKNDHQYFLESAAGLADQLTAFRQRLIKNPTK